MSANEACEVAHHLCGDRTSAPWERRTTMLLEILAVDPFSAQYEPRLENPWKASRLTNVGSMSRSDRMVSVGAVTVPVVATDQSGFTSLGSSAVVSFRKFDPSKSIVERHLSPSHTRGERIGVRSTSDVRAMRFGVLGNPELRRRGISMQPQRSHPRLVATSTRATTPTRPGRAQTRPRRSDGNRRFDSRDRSIRR